jgi:O-succinylbenzoate synthase
VTSVATGASRSRAEPSAVAVRFEAVELIEVSARLRFRFETSFGAQQELTRLLVVLHAEGLEGLGEVVAMGSPGYSHETTATAWEVLESHVLPVVVGRSFATPAQLLAALAGIRGHDMAVAGVETAFWDLLARRAGMPLWQLLGGVRSEVEVGASIGIQRDVAATVAAAERHAAEGYRRLKFKIAPGWDVEPLRAVRAALPDAVLTVDANSAYRLSDARVFDALDELGLDYIEQPLGPADLHDHALLQRRLRTPICLDESIHSSEDTRKALASDAGRVINVKVGRVRGHLSARRIHDVALAFGAPVWCGGMLELGVGRAHNLHMSTLEGYTLPGDTASASRYWEEDVIDTWLDATDGVQHVPQGPGLGVDLDRAALGGRTVRRAEVLP